jgi:ABC-type uncharacterized transport system substrate-binding protein
VDYDDEPSKAVFRTFSQHFRAEPRSGGWQLQYVGADVTDSPRLHEQMRRLLRERPTLIVATSVTVAETLESLHPDVPVYFIIQSDPVRDGLVRSLRSTGGMTGYTFFVPLDVKTLEIVGRIFGPQRRVGIVTDAFWLKGRNMSVDLFEQCRALGMQVTLFRVETGDEIARLPLDPRVRDIDVWYVPYSPTAFHLGPQIVAALSQTRPPTVFARRKFLKYGGLLSIQAVDPDAMDIWAKTILDIESGVPVGSIPVMRPKEIEIAANPAQAARLDAATRARIAREITSFESDSP